MSYFRPFSLALCSALALSSTAYAQNSPGSGPVSAENVLLEPAAVAPTAEQVADFSVPEGFEIEIWAEDLGNARMLAISEIGNVYLTQRQEGQIVMLGNGDGEASAPQTVLELENVHGIHIAGPVMYIATIKEVYSAPINDDGTLGELELLVDDIPDAGQHPNRTLALGPDGLLYLSIGSTCNACDEPDPEHATIVTMTSEGEDRTIFAEGLRNTIGFGWHPVSGALWGVDHGSDARGSEVPYEELNLIEEGSNYGWPWCYGEREVDDLIAGIPEGFDTKDAFCEATEIPVLTYAPHAAPLQAAFYTGEAFPEDYRNDMFQVMRGSWNANPPTGYEVARVDFDENGEPVAFEPFITGWLVEDEDGEGWTQLGRLAGLATTPGGAILISDDQNGIVYRITHTGE